MSIFMGCAKDFQSSSGHLDSKSSFISGGNWTEELQDGFKNLRVCGPSQPRFASLPSWCDHLTGEPGKRSGCRQPGKSQACFDCTASERVSTPCLASKCVFGRQRESESWKTGNKSCLLS